MKFYKTMATVEAEQYVEASGKLPPGAYRDGGDVCARSFQGKPLLVRDGEWVLVDQTGACDVLPDNVFKMCFKPIPEEVPSETK